MSFIRWSLILICKYIAIYALNSLKLGILILILRFSISILIRIKFLSWLSLIFFIIYIGGLLVLFFYLSSLKYNPLLSKKGSYQNLKSFIIKLKILILVILSLTYYKFKGKIIRFTGKNSNKFSYNLFKNEEGGIIIILGIVLLVVLWLVTKLTCKSRGALRPTFQ